VTKLTTVTDKTYTALTPFFESGYTVPLRDAMARLLTKVPSRPAFVLEGMGGFGLDTMSVQELWPGVPQRVYECDRTTYEKMLRNIDTMPPACQTNLVAINDFYAGEDKVPDNTLLILSMNTFTLLPRRVEEAAPFFRPDARWVAYVDMAAQRLHLTYRAYGFTERPTYEEYARRSAAVLGRRYIGYERGHRAFNMVLLGERV
jgi:hypothetical protein